jgi:molybdopterin-guanine dinucleotide biosynthesis protein A
VSLGLIKKQSNITAFILAGGSSSRIGSNKALLEIGGKSLISRLIEIVHPIFDEVIISSNESELYEGTDKRIIKDIITGRGPLGGIHSALQFTKTEKNFFVSCDMPFISKDVIEFLCGYKSEKAIMILKADRRIQQLCGIYSKRIFPDVDSLLKESNQKDSQLKGSIFDLLNRVDSEIIDVSGLKFYHPDLFFNINTPDDFNYAKNILEKK